MNLAKYLFLALLLFPAATQAQSSSLAYDEWETCVSTYLMKKSYAKKIITGVAEATQALSECKELEEQYAATLPANERDLTIETARKEFLQHVASTDY